MKGVAENDIKEHFKSDVVLITGEFIKCQKWASKTIIEKVDTNLNFSLICKSIELNNLRTDKLILKLDLIIDNENPNDQINNDDSDKKSKSKKNTIIGVISAICVVVIIVIIIIIVVVAKKCANRENSTSEFLDISD